MNILQRVLFLTLPLYLEAVETQIGPPNYEKALPGAVIEVINEFFEKKSGHIHILEKESYHISYLTNEILRGIRGPISYQLWNKNINRQGRPRLYNLIIVDNYETLQELFRSISDQTHYFRGYFLIVFEEPIAELEEKLERTFQVCYNLYILNVNVLVKQSNSAEEIIEMYTYFPFTQRHCHHMKPKLYNTFTRGTFINKLEMFPPKTDNFYGCPVVVIAWNYPPNMFFTRMQNRSVEFSGIDAEILRTVAAKMNFSVKFIFPVGGSVRGTIYRNGTATGAIGMIIRGIGNLSICAHRGLFVHSGRISVSMNYFHTSIVFAVPILKYYSSFEKLFFAFRFQVWFLTLNFYFGGIFVIVIARLLNRNYYSFIAGKDNHMPYLNMFTITTGGAVVNPPKRNFARTLFIVWAFGMLVLRSSFQGALFGFIQKSEERKTTQSLLSLLDEGYTLYVPEDCLQWFDRYPQFRNKIFETNLSLWSYFIAMQNTSYKGIVLTTLDQIDYFNRRNPGNATIRILPERLFHSPLSIYYRKNSFLKKPIDEILHDLVTGGLIEHWASQYFYEQRPDQAVQTKYKAVRNADLLGCYELMVVLISLSCTIFALELATKKFQITKVFMDFFTY